MRAGAAYTAKGDSPAVSGHPDYHLDVPLDMRPSFARSVADDGGFTNLVGVSEHSPSVREALLAKDGINPMEGATTVMKPRAVEVQRGDGEGSAKRGRGTVMSSRDVGLRDRAIKIQRQVGSGLEMDSNQKTFISDGTVAGLQRMNETRVRAVEDVKTGAAKTAAAALIMPPPEATYSAGPVTQLAPAAPKTKYRVTFMPPGGGKVRTTADDVIILSDALILVYDAAADSMYEPETTAPGTLLGIQIGDTVYRCLYSAWSGEHNSAVYLVFIVAESAPIAGAPVRPVVSEPL
jgi:hypothetical protein